MKQVKTIELKRAIIHMVDAKKSKLTHSAGELKLEPPSEKNAYFQHHISKSLQDSASRTATLTDTSRFHEFNKGLTAAKFIATTKEIATHLYDSSDKRISAGAIAFCLYSSPEIPGAKQFLAILKLDPSTGFHPVEQLQKDGTVIIDFEKVEGVVPSLGERLLKCAFLKPTSFEEIPYDLIVLDRQTATSDEPARFFLEKFLGAEFAGQPADMTKQFYLASVGILEKNRAKLGNTRTEQLRNAVTSKLLTSNSVDVKEWCDDLNVTQAIKDQLLEELKDKIPDPSFEIDKDEVGRLTKRRVFKGAYGFRMSLESQHYDKVVYARKKTPKYEELTLRIPNFEEFDG